MLLLLLLLACTPSRETRPSVPGASEASEDSAPLEDSAADCPSDPRRPFPQRLRLPGTRSRLGGDPLVHEEAVLAAYQDWTESWLAQAPPATDGSPRYRVRTGGEDSPTVSEGQGYGMVLVATMAGADPLAQARFDGLWRFAQDHASVRDPRLMDWHVPADELDEGGADNSAFDGDADIAMGLLLADAQWGSDCGVDYRAAAARVLEGLQESAVGPDSRLPLLGDWVGVWEDDYDQWDFRSSDVMPAHFTAFAALDPAWEDVREQSLLAAEAVERQLGPQTGLLPDFALDGGDGAWEARPNYLEGPTDDDWSYNAVRAPWRLGQAGLEGDERAASLALGMSRWAEQETGGDPTALRAGYRLDGGTLQGSGYWHPLFAATLGPAAMNDIHGQAWLDAIWAAVAAERHDYYSDTVSLLAMLVMTENTWLP